MQLPTNTFKQALAEKRAQIGLWVGLANTSAAEALAGTGYDWLLIDGEHAPNDVRTIMAQLQAVAPYPVHPIVRPVQGEVALIKQLLDVGAQTLLVPMVDTAEQAALMVRAMRYPPEGIRGLGSALARASRWNQIAGYAQHANREMCLLVQVESVLAVQNLAAIAATDGVDGVFFGPADLSASMGYLGQPNHPEVQRVLLDSIRTVRAAGKAPGILATDLKLAQQYLDAGALFVAIGVDTSMLVRAATELLRQFRQDPAPAAPKASGGY
jgi:4-hydroxy-2-oxoheptanedioate aldolase